MRKASGGPGTRRWAIGVDLGGTWLRVVAFGDRGRRRQVKRPSPGLAGLPDVLTRLWRRWGLERDDVEALVVASRGVWTSAERRLLQLRLRALARQIKVTSDVEAAYLGALGEGAGVLLLAGTGSMALGRDTRGRWARAGGWGPLLGDEGSAFWIGREWLRVTIGATGFAQARRILGSADPVARIAALAPGVLRRAQRGSRDAQRIVGQSQDVLGELLGKIARDLRLLSPVTVSWSGGLLEGSRFRAGVWRATRRAGLHIKPRSPHESALAAVCHIARALARGGQGSVARGRRAAATPSPSMTGVYLGDSP